MKTPKQICFEYKNGDIILKNKIKTFFTMICSLAVAIFKFVFGIVIKSFVWAYSGIYALGGSVAKFLFLKSTHDKYNERGKANYCIAIAVILFISAIIFDMCSMIKQFEEKTISQYPLAIIIIATIYLFVTFILTFIGLLRNRKNKSLNLFTNKIIGTSGALMNMVLLQRLIMSCLNLPIETFKLINSSFAYIIGACMALIAVFLLIKCLLHRKNFPKENKVK